VWPGQINSKRVIAPITLELDRNGFISHYAVTGSAHFWTGTLTVHQEASYTPVQPAEKSAWSAFAGEQKPAS
jgi:hypothetical protein